MGRQCGRELQFSPIATVWEIEIKRAAGRLEAPDELIDVLGRGGIETLPVTAVDAVGAARLPMHHGEPFDRLLVAQAQRPEALVVSRDEAMAAYDIQILPA
ncbi:MAG TPA: type II toxin-antitoxin system VapC family toxin [Candidatus Limnocylindria bacterium]|nr:type II toxin-antitoxin system VapC family toxin [Candidatus Limnocylindria bacterium]